MSYSENPNAPNKDGDTPMIAAASSGHLEIVRLLMTSTANPILPTMMDGLQSMLLL